MSFLPRVYVHIGTGVGGVVCVTPFCSNELLHELPLMVSARGRLDPCVCITTTEVVFPVNFYAEDFSQTVLC